MNDIKLDPSDKAIERSIAVGHQVLGFALGIEGLGYSASLRDELIRDFCRSVLRQQSERGDAVTFSDPSIRADSV